MTAMLRRLVARLAAAVHHDDVQRMLGLVTMACIGAVTSISAGKLEALRPWVGPIEAVGVVSGAIWRMPWPPHMPWLTWGCRGLAVIGTALLATQYFHLTAGAGELVAAVSILASAVAHPPLRPADSPGGDDQPPAPPEAA